MYIFFLRTNKKRLLNDYKSKLNEIDEMSFPEIRRVANSSLYKIYINRCKKDKKKCNQQLDQLWNDLDNGELIIERPEYLLRYFRAFGSMHKCKMDTALDALKETTNLPEIIKSGCSVIDWGCGQGLATICLLDFLKTEKIEKTIERIVLIEPSRAALDYANLYLSYYKDCWNDIEEHQLTIDKAISKPLQPKHKSPSRSTIHLFSNILDIENEIDLKALAEKILSMKGDHYVICISPILQISERDKRIDDFVDKMRENKAYEFLFQREEDALEYDEGEKTCTMNLRLFKINN